MTKLTKKILGRLSLLLILLTVPLWVEAQKPSRKVSKAQKKAEKVDDQQKKAYQAARKKEVKRRYNMQTPEVKVRMKQTRKEADGFNKVKRDPFFDRLFQKKKHTQRKKRKKR